MRYLPESSSRSEYSIGAVPMVMNIATCVIRIATYVLSIQTFVEESASLPGKRQLGVRWRYDRFGKADILLLFL